MALNTEFITASEVKAIAIDEPNLDEGYFTKRIFPTQEKYIKDTLGLDYYRDLQDKYDGGTPDAEDITLMDNYIKPALAYFTTYIAWPLIHTKIENKGAMLDSSETSNQASASGVYQARQRYFEMAEVYRNNIFEYIEEVRETTPEAYPLFPKCVDQNSSRKNGIFVSKKRRRMYE